MVDFKQTKDDFKRTKDDSKQTKDDFSNTPCKGKSFKTSAAIKLLPLQGALLTAVYTQGVALG